MSSDCQTVSFYDRKIGRNAAESANVFVGSYLRAVSVRQIHCQATAAPAVSLAERPPAKQEQQDTGHDGSASRPLGCRCAHFRPRSGYQSEATRINTVSGAHDAPPPQWEFSGSSGLLTLHEPLDDLRHRRVGAVPAADHIGHQPGPPGLMRCAQARAVVAVEVLKK